MTDLLNSPEDMAFRKEIRDFVAAELDPDTRAKVVRGAPLVRDDFMMWHRSLYQKGWAAPGWPKEHGGPGWSARQRLIADEELFRLHTPPLPGFGFKMIGPILMRFGSTAQQQRFLPRILSGEDWWCQGFSETGAGSDLAALRTRAERTKGGWLISGSKTWTTYAQYANWIFCLVRTDPDVKKQEGISMMLVDMSAPGLTRRGIRLMDGTEEVNEIFLDQVFVPDDMVVGEINMGWTYAKALLEHERLGIGGIGRSKHLLERAREMARAAGCEAEPEIADALAEFEIDIMAIEATTLRLMAAAEAGVRIGAETSLLKIRGTETQQGLTELMLDIAGPSALPARDSGATEEPFENVAFQFMNWRKLSIYGGSNEIQRSILASQVLGL
ncbi:alkylation response protein AidB-like acyl-CoA dehydrogenase [Roseovarius halotolerans]|uniref:Acyl-CoA dehydrogenase n=1 Tax=Roseovarius halotolerans TaxID=505353 RepID=A0A1X6Y7C9_9RHOB|nr:acyl-CoA dehydrogenase family protein [Roseovarius halotolerans]RKT35160.1 alkylation response protein AidB-like acyl-CoA dehydrogenase [Roseovarius halotolerans]SLN12895.1 Acyl-CoA dehydrogenase [Roseovarius halotolerans]